MLPERQTGCWNLCVRFKTTEKDLKIQTFVKKSKKKMSQNKSGKEKLERERIGFPLWLLVYSATTDASSDTSEDTFEATF